MPAVCARRRSLACLVAIALAGAPAVALAQAPASPSLGDSGAAAGTSAPVQVAPPARPAALKPLYISLASLQVLDIATTVHALDRGAVEANPIVGDAFGSPAAMLAVKVGFTALSIYSAEKLWKRNRTAAIVMMAAFNGAYAAVVAHNYKVGR